jgi:uncharacterized protein (TIGR03000 family)
VHRTFLPGALACALACSATLALAPPALSWEKILPHHFGRYTVPPRVYGYRLDDDTAGFYGGSRYREYYSFGRGYALADFPGPVPEYHGDLLRHRYWPYDERPRVYHPNNYPAGAVIIVEVPDGAEVWLEGQRSAQSGTTRTFFSPPLPKNEKFVYQIRARWREQRGAREQIHDVAVQAGHRVHVAFPLGSELEAVPLPRLVAPPTTQP